MPLDIGSLGGRPQPAFRQPIRERLPPGAPQRTLPTAKERYWSRPDPTWGPLLTPAQTNATTRDFIGYDPNEEMRRRMMVAYLLSGAVGGGRGFI